MSVAYCACSPAGAALAHKHNRQTKNKTDTHMKGGGAIWLLKDGGREPCMQFKGIGTSVGNTDNKQRKEKREMVFKRVNLKLKVDRNCRIEDNSGRYWF